MKDETGNVAGSHKGRHLMGLAIWLDVVEVEREPTARRRELRQRGARGGGDRAAALVR